MYLDKEKQREAVREAVKRHRDKKCSITVIPKPSITESITPEANTVIEELRSKINAISNTWSNTVIPGKYDDMIPGSMEDIELLKTKVDAILASLADKGLKVKW